MKVIIFSILIIILLRFGMYSYKQGDRQIPGITVIASIILIIIMLLI